MKSNTDFREHMVDITGVSTIVKNSNTMEEPQQKSPGRLKLEKWLHSFMKIEMTDGRTLIGSFLCTDRDNNIILGSCSEYLKPDEDGKEEEPRMLGLAMVPGRHIVSICIDDSSAPQASTSGHVYT